MSEQPARRSEHLKRRGLGQRWAERHAHAHGLGNPHTAHWKWGRSRALRQQVFVWLSITIVVTAVTVGLVFKIGGKGRGPFDWDWESAQALLAGRFERAWDDPSDRNQFAANLAQLGGAGVRLTDQAGAVLYASGPECTQSPIQLPIRRGTQTLGHATLCFGEGRGHFAGTGLIALFVALAVLWGAAAKLARRITQPLSQLIAVTREMGSGNLAARVRLGRHGSGELKVLADSVNDMGRRIERQLKDQRELLAVVSHEVRSPLARIRVCSELLRADAEGRDGSARALDMLDQEVAEVDALLGKLLAHSRLDFEALSKTAVLPAELMTHAMKRHSLGPEALRDDVGNVTLAADVTLLARALDNVLDNAERHGRAPLRCAVRLASASEQVGGKPAVVFVVRDHGGGFSAEALPRVFDAFYRTGEAQGAAAAGLGLGLSLVKRIALAHGGTAWAMNHPDGGASVAFSVALESAAAAAT